MKRYNAFLALFILCAQGNYAQQGNDKQEETKEQGHEECICEKPSFVHTTVIPSVLSVSVVTSCVLCVTLCCVACKFRRFKKLKEAEENATDTFNYMN